MAKKCDHSIFRDLVKIIFTSKGIWNSGNTVLNTILCTKSQSLNYHSVMASGYIDIIMKKSEFVTNVKFQKFFCY